MPLTENQAKNAKPLERAYKGEAHEPSAAS
jgi:hypothetical protein